MTLFFTLGITSLTGCGDLFAGTLVTLEGVINEVESGINEGPDGVTLISTLASYTLGVLLLSALLADAT